MARQLCYVRTHSKCVVNISVAMWYCPLLCSSNRVKAWFHHSRENLISINYFSTNQIKILVIHLYKIIKYVFIFRIWDGFDTINVMIMRIQYIVVIFRFILFIVSFAQGYGNSKLIFSLIFLLIINHNYVINLNRIIQKHKGTILYSCKIIFLSIYQIIVWVTVKID